jgi:RNase P subunit RPR2
LADLSYAKLAYMTRYTSMAKRFNAYMDVSEGYKRCSNCKNAFLASTEFFHARKASKDGLQPMCKECEREITRSRRGYSERISPYAGAPEGSKFCNKCKGLFPLNQFDFDSGTPDKLSYRCKQCKHEYRAAYYQGNKHSEFSSMKAWQEENAAYLRGYRRGRNKNRSALNKQKCKEWRLKNPHKWVLYDARRRARKLGLPDTFTREEEARCLTYWGNRCAISGETTNLHFDHWIPLASPLCPGTIATNMIPLAGKLNHSKWANHPEQWVMDVYGETEGRLILQRIYAYFEWVQQQ